MRSTRGLLLSAMGVVLGLGTVHPVVAQEVSGYRARIQSGTCAELGDNVIMLQRIGAAATADGTPVPAPTLIGVVPTTVLLQSATTIKITLSELVEMPYTVVVSTPDAEAQSIACGEIGGVPTSQMAGMVMPGDELAIVLREEHGSGYAGIALVTAAGLEASVRVYLTNGFRKNQP